VNFYLIQDFSASVTYAVTAENGTAKTGGMGEMWDILLDYFSGLNRDDGIDSRVDACGE
jgi:hypothetical protein